MPVMTPDREVLKRTRQRSRIPLKRIAQLLDISIGACSEYENGKKPLPHALDADDYERAIAQAILERPRS